MNIKNIIKNKLGDKHVYFNIIKDGKITFVSEFGDVNIDMEEEFSTDNLEEQSENNENPQNEDNKE